MKQIILLLLGERMQTHTQARALHANMGTDGQTCSHTHAGIHAQTIAPNDNALPFEHKHNTHTETITLIAAHLKMWSSSMSHSPSHVLHTDTTLQLPHPSCVSTVCFPSQQISLEQELSWRGGGAVLHTCKLPNVACY